MEKNAEKGKSNAKRKITHDTRSGERKQKTMGRREEVRNTKVSR